MTDPTDRPAEKIPSCRWDGSVSAWLSPEHLATCRTTTCAGCRPCGEDHCAFRGRCPNHVQVAAGIVTCPSCIARVKRDLDSIEDLHAATHDEAVHAGLDSEAMNLAGPAATVDQVAARRAYAVADLERVEAQRGWCALPRGLDSDDQHHPYSVLGRWELGLREEYNQRTDLFVTTSSAARFLRSLMRETNLPHVREFEVLAADLARCRAHLEAVLHDSRTPEQGRPCPTCSTLEEPGPRLRKRYARHDRTGDSDTWHCPRDGAHWWTERDYRDRLAVDFQAHALELPASELAERIGVPLTTVRYWTTRRWDKAQDRWIEPKLKTRRRGPDGRKLYAVVDGEALAGATPSRATA